MKKWWRKDAVGNEDGGTVPECLQKNKQCNKPYKQRTPLPVRRQEVASIHAKFPGKIPIVVERFTKEKSLPNLDKSKFLVPPEVLLSQFITIIRNRLSVAPSQSLYLLVNNRSLVSMTLTMGELYSQHHDDDGFLYMTFASQEIFG